MESNKIPNNIQPRNNGLIDAQDEPFVSLYELKELEIKMQYPRMGYKEATNACLLREEAALKLKEASVYLPEGIHLCVWDAWRPFSLQKELYDSYKAKIIEKFSLRDKSDDEIKEKVSEFVSVPTDDVFHPPVHTTGGAIDVTLVDDQGETLDMGTSFDSFKNETRTDWYEHEVCNPEIIKVRNNRRMLYMCMTKAGFSNLPSEWWHYDFGDWMWAYYSNNATRYIGIFTEENLRNKMKLK